MSALEQFDYPAGLPFGFGNANTSKIVLIATSREPECALGRRLRNCKFDQRFDPPFGRLEPKVDNDPKLSYNHQMVKNTSTTQAVKQWRSMVLPTPTKEGLAKSIATSHPHLRGLALATDYYTYPEGRWAFAANEGDIEMLDGAGSFLRSRSGHVLALASVNSAYRGVSPEILWCAEGAFIGAPAGTRAAFVLSRCSVLIVLQKIIKVIPAHLLGTPLWLPGPRIGTVAIPMDENDSVVDGIEGVQNCVGERLLPFWKVASQTSQALVLGAE